MTRLDLLRVKLCEITHQVLSAEKDVQTDFWRRIAIYQNGFAWREDHGSGLNQLFRTDQERAEIKLNSFRRAQFKHLEKGEFGDAFSFGLMAVFTEVCAYGDDALIEEFSEVVREMGVVLRFPEVCLGSAEMTSVDMHWKRIGTLH